MLQTKEQGKNLQDQINEDDIGNSTFIVDISYISLGN